MSAIFWRVLNNPGNPALMRAAERKAATIRRLGFFPLMYTDRDMRYAVTTKYTSDASTIAKARPAHREYLKGLAEQGRLVMSGPFADDSGGLFIYEADDAAQVENCIRQDPFARNGVFVSWEVRPWNVIFMNRTLLCGDARRE